MDESFCGWKVCRGQEPRRTRTVRRASGGTSGPPGGIGLTLAMAMTMAWVAQAAASLEVSDRFRLDLDATLGVMTSRWVEFDPPREGTAPLVAEASLGIEDDSVQLDQWFVSARGTYTLGDRDDAVAQLVSRRFGDSPLTDAAGAIEIDRLFYEHRFGRATRVRLGRTPVPFGLLNEVREAGIELPFFRAPFSFYDEGGFIGDSVDGLRITQRLGADKGWGLDADVYGGRWELLEMAGAVNRLAGTVDGVSTRVDTVDAEGFGWALTLRSPGGFRLAGGQQRFSTSGSRASNLPGEEGDWENDFLSVEFEAEGFLFRGEVREARFPVNFFFSAIGLPAADPAAGMRVDTEAGAWYGTLGIPLGKRWQGSLQWERSGGFLQCFVTSGLRCDPLTEGQNVFFNKPHGERTWVDKGVALSFRPNESFLIRGEFHRTDGLALRRDLSVQPDFQVHGLTREDPSRVGHYILLSVAWQH